MFKQCLLHWSGVVIYLALAKTIIDRKVHHSTIIQITDKSYRIKDKFIGFSQTDEEKSDE